MGVNTSNHLSSESRINFGSFYTPEKYVRLVGQWLSDIGMDKNYIIADITCGGGAFFKLNKILPDNKYVGNDIDEVALQTAKTCFPFVNLIKSNAFSGISREKFGLTPADKLIIVGNPPWNDTTSIINNDKKKNLFNIDEDIKTRDLGVSALLSYNKLHADFVAVLHPLSYLIKYSNFKMCGNFFKHYELINHVIFNSQEFANTSKTAGFPVIVGLYKPSLQGITYQDVKKFKFKTTDGKIFSLNDRDYISDYIDKYPHKRRYKPELLFYTQRDINALKRCKTFIKDRCGNAVDINPQKLPYYCYLDCFKRFANIPYFLGNFNVPFIKQTFDEIAGDVVSVSKYFNQNIFGKSSKPTERQISKVKSYINSVINYNNSLEDCHDWR